MNKLNISGSKTALIWAWAFIVWIVVFEIQIIHRLERLEVQVAVLQAKAYQNAAIKGHVDE